MAGPGLPDTTGLHMATALTMSLQHILLCSIWSQKLKTAWATLKRTARWPDPQGQLRFVGTILRTGFHVERGNRGEGLEFRVFVPTGPGCWSAGPCPHAHSAPSPEQPAGGTLSTSHTVNGGPPPGKLALGRVPCSHTSQAPLTPHPLPTWGPLSSWGALGAAEGQGGRGTRVSPAAAGQQPGQRAIPSHHTASLGLPSFWNQGRPPFPGPAGGLANR